LRALFVQKYSREEMVVQVAKLDTLIRRKRPKLEIAVLNS
jgi:hypothetical protein